MNYEDNLQAEMSKVDNTVLGINRALWRHVLAAKISDLTKMVLN